MHIIQMKLSWLINSKFLKNERYINFQLMYEYNPTYIIWFDREKYGEINAHEHWTRLHFLYPIHVDNSDVF
jgi:hypothetical protein